MPLLRVPEPHDFELSTERFRAFGPDLANLWREGGLLRVVGGREVRIEAAPGGVAVEPLDAEIRRVVERLLGLPFDLAAFEEFAAADPVLSGLVRRLRGLRPPLAPDPFESLVTSITAQQVSLFAAFAVRNRLIERFGARGSRSDRGLVGTAGRPANGADGSPGEAGGHAGKAGMASCRHRKRCRRASLNGGVASDAYAFPTRQALARAREEELVALGFSRRKAEYVLALAHSGLDLDGLDRLPDEEVKATLVAQRGLGEWTADWFLARHLARPRAWPAGDLGLRKAVSVFYGVSDDVRAFGERFDPFQNLAAHYLLVGLRTR